IPGVAGIGEKGAKSLIQEYGNLENLLENASQLTRKAYREGLAEHRHLAELSKDLATIHRDIDIPFEPDQLHRDPPDQERLLELFRELEFFTLVAELEDAAAAQRKPAEPAVEARTPEAWSSAAAAFEGEDLYALTLGEQDLVGLVVAGGEADPVFGDLRREGLRETMAASLEGWLGDPARTVVGHDLKEVLRLAPREVPVEARLFDTMLASYVLHPSLRSHALEEVALDRLHAKATTAAGAGWTKKRGVEVPPDLGSPDLLAYAGERLDLVRRLREDLEEALQGGPLEEVYRTIEEPLVPVLVGMEERGVLLDCAFLGEMSAELEADVAALEGEIYQLAGERFNVNSPQQLGVILFEKLGYPVMRRTQKTKSYATGAEVLEQLAARGYPLPERILRFRELAKLKSTYVDALPALVGEDGRLHTRFNQAVAATGRLSSANPNLQNIPVRTERGQQIRKAFVAAPGNLLLVADYSQVELRILA
ncbi:MAG: DNA polymerase I, partial [Acidobacteria bacterium]|nr:DNA polymerase I [Acidobacteriota bacterium]